MAGSPCLNGGGTTATVSPVPTHDLHSLNAVNCFVSSTLYVLTYFHETLLILLAACQTNYTIMNINCTWIIFTIFGSHINVHVPSSAQCYHCCGMETKSTISKCIIIL